MYVALRASVRAALHLYCGRIRVDVRSAPAANAVLILASNHPNSFFDALVIATHPAPTACAFWRAAMRSETLERRKFYAHCS
jgi:1-acyl-sn-glycerol-3-phosphate acyltransferase